MTQYHQVVNSKSTAEAGVFQKTYISEMTAIGQSEAEWKFWQTPELIESLLLHLDSESTLRLAQTHLFTRSIVQGNRVWKNVILQNSPMIYESNVEDLMAILRLMDDYSYNMMDLLDAICQDNPVHNA